MELIWGLFNYPTVFLSVITSDVNKKATSVSFSIILKFSLVEESFTNNPAGYGRKET
jgi:hypothetical protein